MMNTHYHITFLCRFACDFLLLQYLSFPKGHTPNIHDFLLSTAFRLLAATLALLALRCVVKRSIITYQESLFVDHPQ